MLRYLTIRTDEDLRRALRKGKRPPVAAEAVGMAPPRPSTGPGLEPGRADSGREN